MEYFELEPDWEVVLDTGHSAAVRAIVEVDGLVVSGGDDGFVFVRGRDGASVVPPAHLRAVRCLVPVPGTYLCLVGTRQGLVGLDLRTGMYGELEGFEDTGVVAGGAVDGLVALGADGGRVAVSVDGSGFRDLLRSGPAVRAVGTHDDVVVVANPDATVGFGVDGSVRWRHATGAEPSIAVGADGSVVVAHHPPGGSTAVVERLRVADGSVLASATVPVPVRAVGWSGSEVVVLRVDGSTETLAPSLDPRSAPTAPLADAVPQVVSSGASSGAWTGWLDGAVRSLDGAVVLPACASGVHTVSVDGDESVVVGADADGLRCWDLRSGDERSQLALPGVRSVAFAAEGTDDVVVALLDGTIERRTGPAWGELVASSRLARPARSLGYFGGRIVGMDAAAVEILDADTLAPSALPEDVLAGVAVMERQGAWFVGRGMLAGVDVAFVEGRGPVVRRPGLLAVPPAMLDVVRIWDGGGFLALEP